MRTAARRARSQVDKKGALENLDLIFMTLDELVDGGCGAAPPHTLTHALVHSHATQRCRSLRRSLPARCAAPTPPALRSIILETDASVIAGRVSMRGSDGEVPLSEQTFSQALASAKEQLARSLLS